MKRLEFSVNDIPQGGKKNREIEVLPSEIDLEMQDVKFPGPVCSRIQLLRNDQDIYVKANVSVPVVVYCRRCLEPVQSNLFSDLELQFCQVEEPEKNDSNLLDVGERHYAGGIMDLSEDVRQAIVLEIPIWPLCSDLCEGLCCNCGENLNLSKCSCDEVIESSSPFMGLSVLRKENANRREPF